MTTPPTSSRAVAHDGSAIPFAVGGAGPRWLFLGLGGGTPSVPESMAPWIEGLGRDYRIIFIEYPGEPKQLTLTPDAVARDYLAVADAAGADRFAYYGFSWGAVSGLQLAIRSDRVAAFIAGGFPMLNGPYAEMLHIVETGTRGPIQLYDLPPMEFPEAARQFVTYYQGLRTFDDRAAQAKLRCPRLSFVGTADDVTLNGKLLTRLGQTIIDTRSELEGYGWEVQLLEGMGHAGANGAARPEVAIPIIREFLGRRFA